MFRGFFLAKNINKACNIWIDKQGKHAYTCTKKYYYEIDYEFKKSLLFSLE